MLFSQSLAVSHLSGILNHMKHSVNDYRINSQKHQQTVICLNRTFATLLLKDFIHFFFPAGNLHFIGGKFSCIFSMVLPFGSPVTPASHSLYFQSCFPLQGKAKWSVRLFPGGSAFSDSISLPPKHQRSRCWEVGMWWGAGAMWHMHHEGAIPSHLQVS